MIEKETSRKFCFYDVPNGKKPITTAITSKFTFIPILILLIIIATMYIKELIIQDKHFGYYHGHPKYYHQCPSRHYILSSELLHTISELLCSMYINLKFPDRLYV